MSGRENVQCKLGPDPHFTSPKNPCCNARSHSRRGPGLGAGNAATQFYSRNCCFHGIAARCPRAAAGDAGDGFIHAGSPESIAHLVPAFRTGLDETGFVEGQNVAIEFRYAQNISERLSELAADLVRRQVAVVPTP